MALNLEEEHSLESMLEMVRSSLFPGEEFSFTEESAELWNGSDWLYNPDSSLPNASFTIKLDNWRTLWFEITLQRRKDAQPNVLVKGSNLSKEEQGGWQNIVAELLSKLTYGDE